MEQEGVITGYHAHLAPKALGHALMVFVTVSLKSTDEKTLRAFNAAVKPVKQILECHMVGGGFDYLLKIRVRDMGEYREILGGRLGALPMVESTHSYFVMEEVKEEPFLDVSRAKEQRMHETETPPHPRSPPPRNRQLARRGPALCRGAHHGRHPLRPHATRHRRPEARRPGHHHDLRQPEAVRGA